MSEQKTLNVSFLVSAGPHNQAVIEDLWSRAARIVDAAGWQLRGTAAYLGAPGSVTQIQDGTLKLVAINAPSTGKLSTFAASASTKPGPVGVAGRLLRDNLRSREVAHVVAQRKELLAALVASDVVVSGEVSADRAVWKLRKQTKAELVHGPVAMAHSLRKLVSA